MKILLAIFAVSVTLAAHAQITSLADDKWVRARPLTPDPYRLGYFVEEGRLVYRHKNRKPSPSFARPLPGKIIDPVRRVDGKFVFLWNGGGDDWKEYNGLKVLQVLRGGGFLVVHRPTTAMTAYYKILNLPGNPIDDDAVPVSLLRSTGETFRYTGTSGGGRTVRVLDYGEVPSVVEALKAVQSASIVTTP